MVEMETDGGCGEMSGSSPDGA
eukprot:SAG31_NODE_27149_length_430_cov_1.398792_1_plen_21_part_10